MAKGDFNGRVQEFMQGRNGPDDVTRVCTWGALALIIVYLFVPAWWLSVLALALIVFGWWRMLSRDVAARARENERFMSRLGPLRPWVSSPTGTLRERRSHKVLACPQCGQRLRVPRGKGKVRVRCRRCGTTFEGRS